MINLGHFKALTCREKFIIALTFLEAAHIISLYILSVVQSHFIQPVLYKSFS